MSRWIWAYWMSPFAWSLRAVAINEMTSPPWGNVGIQALESFGFQTDRCFPPHLDSSQPCTGQSEHGSRPNSTNTFPRAVATSGPSFESPNCQPCARGQPNACRKWIWAGIGYNLGITLVLTYFVGLALTYLSPPKARPTTPADEVAMRNKLHQEAVKRSRTTRRLKVT